MTAPARRHRVGDLELTIKDPFERDITYIYDEIFVGDAYAHPRLTLSPGATIMDVGANVGLYSIWAARTYRPKQILAYEASPVTHSCLADNVARHIDPSATAARTFNLAMGARAGETLTLNQPPWNSGLSTLLDGTTLAWVDELKAKGELTTHQVQSTSVSAEIARHGLQRVDLLKIDVEGYFVEVLDGIAAADLTRVRNIVLEAEYTEMLGHDRQSLVALLKSKGFDAEAKDAAQIMIYAWRA